MSAFLKKQVSKLIRSTGLALAFDRLRFYSEYVKNYSKNKHAIKQHPDFIFPPAYFLYETYSLDFEVYFTDGLQTAKEIRDVVEPFVDLKNRSVSILDWGCGPARVVRHWHSIIGTNIDVSGSDYNQQYIDWNSSHIVAVNFLKNDLEPPINLSSDSFDFIYGLSIITHLSADNHVAWINELHRLLKPDGVLLITTQGHRFTHKLLGEELTKFNKGELVVRDSGTEGHRVYAAFQPEAYMKLLLKNFKLLRCIPGGDRESIHGLQETWIVQK